jgi:hypothetical protein
MNERVSESSGLPLRAMVMVLLFLGVIFLLVGMQAMSSGNDTSDDSSTAAVSTTASPSPAPRKADVRVYSVAADGAAANRISDRLREAGWNVTDSATITAADVPATTVYFGSASGEEAAATEIGKVLEAPTAPRIPDIAEQPPGVIVLVTG